MELHQKLPGDGAWFELLFVENAGMAFGMEFGGVWGKLALTLFRIGAVVGIALYLRYLLRTKVSTGLIVSISLIFSGALGNIIDSTFYGVLFSESDYTTVAQFLPEAGGYSSLFYGKVVDMFHFDVLEGASWIPWSGGLFPPVFNIADVSITVGIAIILIKQKTFFPKVTQEELTEKNDVDTPSTSNEGGENNPVISTESN